MAGSSWWPTRPSQPSDRYVGSVICAQCHSSIAETQAQTSMARTLTRAAQSSVIAKNAGQSIHVDGNTYRIGLGSDGPRFTLLRGNRSVSRPLRWAFGSGEISQVYVSDTGSTFLESHFSYFGGIGSFDITSAQSHSGESVPAALGRTIRPQEARRCFSCHAANVQESGWPQGILAGVTCEACHGPGENHVAAEKSGLPNSGTLIVNPAHMSVVDQVDFCGACHMSTVDVENSGAVGVLTVRFPAYRLQNSKCWGDGDARITCTACHDPHQRLSHDPAFYDSRCLSCHLGSPSETPKADHPGVACKVQTRNCTSCHMPKYQFADAHHPFTDHNIHIPGPEPDATAR